MTLPKLAELLGITVDELLSGKSSLRRLFLQMKNAKALTI